MSGIYIPGMEMPKSCEACKLFFIKAYGFTDYKKLCKLGGHVLPYPEDYDRVADDCPLIEVPPHGWIPVTERLPEEYEYVLCKTDYGMEVGYHRDEWGQDEWTTGELGSGTIDVTHWMPLPQPSEKEDIFCDNECEKEDGEACF